MIETKSETDNITRVPCSLCNRIFKVSIDKRVINNLEQFPFPIVLMHYAAEDENHKSEVHTLIAYIDQHMSCRHVTVLDGRRVFITPYILYNPNLIAISCSKNIRGY